MIIVSSPELIMNMTRSWLQDLHAIQTEIPTQSIVFLFLPKKVGYEIIQIQG